MKHTNLSNALNDLKLGHINFTQFYRRTDKDWTALSTRFYSMHRAQLLGNSEVEDVKQEMLAGIATSVEAYDSSRGSMSISRFVVFRAFSQAARYARKQRDAKWRAEDTSSPGVSFVSLDDRACMPSSPANQEWCLDIKQRREAICKTMIDHVIMDTIMERGASIQVIADALFENEMLRQKFDLKSRSRTYTMVRKVTHNIAERAERQAMQ